MFWSFCRKTISYWTFYPWTYIKYVRVGGAKEVVCHLMLLPRCVFLFFIFIFNCLKMTRLIWTDGSKRRKQSQSTVLPRRKSSTLEFLLDHEDCRDQQEPGFLSWMFLWASNSSMRSLLRHVASSSSCFRLNRNQFKPSSESMGLLPSGDAVVSKTSSDLVQKCVTKTNVMVKFQNTTDMFLLISLIFCSSCFCSYIYEFVIVEKMKYLKKKQFLGEKNLKM